MSLTRKQHWDTVAYHDFLLANADAPFEWGVNDCALFAANGIEAMTGVDIAEHFRGYKNHAGALKQIKKVTKATATPTVEHAAVYCAWYYKLVEHKYPLMAQRGDLVLIEDSGRLIVGLVHLNGRDIVCAGEEGLKRLSIMDVKRAWKVG